MKILNRNQKINLIARNNIKYMKKTFYNSVKLLIEKKLVIIFNPSIPRAREIMRCLSC